MRKPGSLAFVVALVLVGCGRKDICDLEVGAAAGTYRVLLNGEEAVIEIDAQGRANAGTGSTCTARKTGKCTLAVRCDDGLSVSIERIAAP